MCFTNKQSERDMHNMVLDSISSALKEKKPIDTSNWPRPLTEEQAQQILTQSLGGFEEET